ncbi:hypothetical protein ATL39_3024 [Sinobaca qinghaiensis]|uniref:Uncharacterized protein n=1 Tax=Sinobaca qinghaiensis TaxID=342944 RepID=A0A419UWU6_9BACL|nr:hypothetical protein [Sinobaca qinghaiensis]RKD69601.1 hypothetical protein ATL39_3024 [Sinobaca qinghaiensis]
MHSYLFQVLAIVGFILFLTALYIQSSGLIIGAILLMITPFVRNIYTRLKNGEIIRAILAVVIVTIVAFIAIGAM